MSVSSEKHRWILNYTFPPPPPMLSFSPSLETILPMPNSIIRRSFSLQFLPSHIFPFLQNGLSVNICSAMKFLFLPTLSWDNYICGFPGERTPRRSLKVPPTGNYWRHDIGLNVLFVSINNLNFLSLKYRTFIFYGCVLLAVWKERSHDFSPSHHICKKLIL